MKTSIRMFTLVLVLAGATAALPLWSNNSSASLGPEVHVTVTAIGLHDNPPPEVTPQDLLVYQNRDRRPVLAWVPVKGKQAGLDLALLIEDSLDTRLGLQLGDLKEFLRSLPPATRVAIFYARDNSAQVAQDFTTDHELAAKHLRLPIGSVTASASPYLALTDLLKRWPHGDNRRAVLLISSGIDLFYGITESNPTLNPALDQAIRRAERDGVPVSSVYAASAGRLRRNFFLTSNGQGSLARLAYETGGAAFFQGFGTPVAFRPLLQEFARNLEHQYLLTFAAEASTSRKGGLQRLRVKTEVPGVELVAPANVYIPAGQ